MRGDPAAAENPVVAVPIPVELTHKPMNLIFTSYDKCSSPDLIAIPQNSVADKDSENSSQTALYSLCHRLIVAAHAFPKTSDYRCMRAEPTTYVEARNHKIPHPDNHMDCMLLMLDNPL